MKKSFDGTVEFRDLDGKEEKSICPTDGWIYWDQDTEIKSVDDVAADGYVMTSVVFPEHKDVDIKLITQDDSLKGFLDNAYEFHSSFHIYGKDFSIKDVIVENANSNGYILRAHI